MNTNQYQEQANTFLATYGIKCRISLSNTKTPTWADQKGEERNHYRVTLSKKQARLIFDWWDSIDSTQKGKHPSAYDILACVNSDSSCPDTFADFCSEYGYDEDSIKARQLFRRCDLFAKRIRAFFTDAELESLREIS